jgi:hypothetical protein
VPCSPVSAETIPFSRALDCSERRTAAGINPISRRPEGDAAIPHPGCSIIPERVRDRKDEEKVIQKSFRGVLLRDVLWKAGLKYKRKWEPGTFIQVRNRDNREIVFSFGEIFYSSIGRSVLIAYEQWNQPCAPTLVVATDIHDGRMMTDLTEIKVSRVDVELLAYQDQEKKIVRPPSTEFTFVDPVC